MEPLGKSRTLQRLPGAEVRLLSKVDDGMSLAPESPQDPPTRIFPFLPSGTGLTSRSSADTSSFSTASMAAAPAILTPQTLLCHRLHGPLTGAEKHFRRPAEAGRVPYAEPIASRRRRRARPPADGEPPRPFHSVMRTLGAVLPLRLCRVRCCSVSTFVFPGVLRMPFSTEAASRKSETMSRWLASPLD